MFNRFLTRRTSSSSRRLVQAALFLYLIPLPVLADSDLWNEIAEGGKVILIRHAPVERDASAGNPLLRDTSCEQERNLSRQGREFAKQLGERFINHRVVIDKVFHSPYCRTTDTARIAFGETSPEPLAYLSLLEVLPPEAAANQTVELNMLIDTYEGDGNLVLITHEPNINAISFELVRHLDMIVIDPNGKDDYEELGIIRFSSTVE